MKFTIKLIISESKGATFIVMSFLFDRFKIKQLSYSKQMKYMERKLYSVLSSMRVLYQR